MQQLSTMMMMTMQFSAAMHYMLLPSRRLFIFWQLAIEEPYQLLLYLGNVNYGAGIKLIILHYANVIVSQCISYLELITACTMSLR